MLMGRIKATQMAAAGTTADKVEKGEHDGP